MNIIPDPTMSAEVDITAHIVKEKGKENFFFVFLFLADITGFAKNAIFLQS